MRYSKNNFEMCEKHLKNAAICDILNPVEINNLIKSGGGTGPMKPRQPAFLSKVLIPEDEKMKSPALSEIF